MAFLRAFRPALVVGVSLTCAGCASIKAYEGDPRPRRELAEIVGDSHFGSLPVAIYIRRVDETEVGLMDRSALVLPGEHDLLIDCTVTESQRTSRHHLHVAVDAGVKYRLVADTSPGNRDCREVEMVSL
jgi:hypothetical protein